GQQCYFGKHDGEEKDATFESEITTFDLGATLVPSMMKRYHYLVHDDRKTDKKAPDPGTEGYHTVVQGRSSAIYTSDATLPLDAFVLNESELEAVTKAEKNRATFSMLTVSGTSQTSKVKIGGKIKVKLPEKMQTTKKDVDTFLVTSVVHEFDIKAEYRNSFVGIPSTVENIPMKPIDYPKAYPQLALVKSNDDEKKLGRVKAEFQWQKDKGKTTNWIRVQTPDAGPNPDARKYKDIVPQNRGFVFIPEEDDIVMINFEYGDPNRPYVAGSIFSEKASKGGDSDNKKKSITTRVDSSMTFDDDEGSVTIKDQKGSDSVMIFDGKKNIVIKADESITLVSGKSIIVLEKDGTITANGTKIFIAASDETNISTGDLEGGNYSGISVAPENIGISAVKDLTEVAQNVVIGGGSNSVVALQESGEITANGKKINLN
ncbi:MAG: phage baseplate assembly protein V, partial [Tannerella sp.]|nr:phage baseplate assembly protein V [Tannerella sp.]